MIQTTTLQGRGMRHAKESRRPLDLWIVTLSIVTYCSQLRNPFKSISIIFPNETSHTDRVSPTQQGRDTDSVIIKPVFPRINKRGHGRHQRTRWPKTATLSSQQLKAWLWRSFYTNKDINNTPLVIIIIIIVFIQHHRSHQKGTWWPHGPTVVRLGVAYGVQYRYM